MQDLHYVHCILIQTFAVYFNPIEKHTDRIFFLNLQTFNGILGNAFAVPFNSIEKYADSQKHTLENTPFFVFWFFERERENFLME